MNRRFVLAAALPLILALTAAAPAPRRAAPPPPPAPLPDLVHVELTTDAGTILLELDARRAPVTAGNFVRYVDQRRFDGTTFYRAMHLPWGDQPNGLIQGGPQNHPRRILPPIAHEPTSQTGIRHRTGTISMARFAPGTATGDFTIMLADMPGLDADPASDNPELRAGFAAFGQVIGGMDVVRRIFEAPRSATLGEGVMRGQMLERPVLIVRARRVPAPPAPPVTPAEAPPATN